jgi:hypothetical protein
MVNMLILCPQMHGKVLVPTTTLIHQMDRRLPHGGGSQ